MLNERKNERGGGEGWKRQKLMKSQRQKRKSYI